MFFRNSSLIEDSKLYIFLIIIYISIIKDNTDIIIMTIIIMMILS